MVAIRPLGPNDREAYQAHLKRVDSSAHAPELQDGAAFVLGAFVDADGRAALIGHLSIHLQPLEHRTDLPLSLLELENTSFSDSYPPGLVEGFVWTFDVEEAHRRRGIGRRLQLAALEECRRRGLYQLRSWSSLDRPANYALKIGLGFAVHPGHTYLPRREKWVRGVYFVMPLR